MINVGTGFSKSVSLEKAALEAGIQALDRAGLSKADTLLVFASLKKPTGWATALKKLKSLAGAKTVIGSSAYGVFTNQNEIERGNGVAVMAFDRLSENISPFLIPHLQESSFRAGRQLAQRIRDWDPDPVLSLIFPDSFSFHHDAFFEGLEFEGIFHPVVGGLSSEMRNRQKTFQWEGGKITYDAVSGLTFGEPLEFEIGMTQSCQPFGDPLQITRSQGNLIYEIDGRPAYDIFLELITELRIEDRREVFNHLFLGLPLENFQTDFTHSHYLVRNILGVNAKKGALACASPVEEGDYVTFALRDPLRARQDLVMMLQDLKERTGGQTPAFGLYFNCCARGMSLYGNPGEDSGLIREYFPELPFIGFFTFGEIGPVGEVNHLHHYSGVLALGFEP